MINFLGTLITFSSIFTFYPILNILSEFLKILPYINKMIVKTLGEKVFTVIRLFIISKKIKK